MLGQGTTNIAQAAMVARGNCWACCGLAVLQPTPGDFDASVIRTATVMDARLLKFDEIS